MVEFKLRGPVKEQFKYISHRINLAIVGLTVGWISLPHEWKTWFPEWALAVFGVLALANSVAQNVKQKGVKADEVGKSGEGN